MYKATYDINDNGVVDDSERLGNELPAYYLAWDNFTGTPTTIAGYGITDAYTEAEVDALIEAENFWDRTGSNLVPHNSGDDIVLASAGAERIMWSAGSQIYELNSTSLRFIVNGVLSLSVNGNGIQTREISFISPSTFNVGSSGTPALGVYGTTLYTNTIDELTVATGVTIEGIKTFL